MKTKTLTNTQYEMIRLLSIAVILVSGLDGAESGGRPQLTTDYFSKIPMDAMVRIAQNLESQSQRALQQTDRKCAFTVKAVKVAEMQSHYRQLVETTSITAEEIFDLFTWNPVLLWETNDRRVELEGFHPVQEYESGDRLGRLIRDHHSVLGRGSLVNGSGSISGRYLVVKVCDPVASTNTAMLFIFDEGGDLMSCHCNFYSDGIQWRSSPIVYPAVTHSPVSMQMLKDWQSRTLPLVQRLIHNQTTEFILDHGAVQVSKGKTYREIFRRKRYVVTSKDAPQRMNIGCSRF